MICNYLFSSTINEYPCQPNFSFVSAPEEFCCREEAFIWCRAGGLAVNRPPGFMLAIRQIILGDWCGSEQTRVYRVCNGLGDCLAGRGVPRGREPEMDKTQLPVAV